MFNKAVFLDRDGTVNADTGYLNDPNLVELLPGVAEGIFKLKNEFGFKIIVVSNQSGISRGLITKDEVEKVNNRINEILKESSAQIDDFYYCPYHPDFDTPDKCICRKPSPYMIQRASEKHNINIAKSFLIGDKQTDIICAKNAGLKSILLFANFNYEKINQLKMTENSPNFIASNFLDAVKFITNNL